MQHKNVTKILRHVYCLTVGNDVAHWEIDFIFLSNWAKSDFINNFYFISYRNFGWFQVSRKIIHFPSALESTRISIWYETKRKFLWDDILLNLTGHFYRFPRVNYDLFIQVDLMLSETDYSSTFVWNQFKFLFLEQRG